MENGPATAEFAGLADRVSELARVCARLSQENAALRERVERLSAGRGTPSVPSALVPEGPVPAGYRLALTLQSAAT